MAVPSDPATDAFLQLIDVLDSEANAVTHAVVRAQATVRCIVDEVQILLDRSDVDRREWTEAGARMLRHRAILMEALVSISHPGLAGHVAHPKSVTVVGTPVPPRPLPVDGALALRPPLIERVEDSQNRALVPTPDPPRLRYPG